MSRPTTMVTIDMPGIHLELPYGGLRYVWAAECRYDGDGQDMWHLFARGDDGLELIARCVDEDSALAAKRLLSGEIAREMWVQTRGW